MLALIGLVRVEAWRDQWSSQVPSGVILIANLIISFFGLIRAVVIDGQKRWFWVGFSIVLVALTIAQTAGVTFPGVGTNAAQSCAALIMKDEGHVARCFGSGHMAQLECILTFGWAPLLAWAGGWYSSRLAASQVSHAND